MGTARARCGRAAASLPLAFALVLAAIMPPAAAQGLARSFPQNALRGEIAFGQPPEVAVNGVAARLAPGSRIRGHNNLLEMSGALMGSKHLVHYTVDDHGLVKDVWLLTEAEAAKKPWPTTLQQARSWVFDPVGQTWTRP